MSEREKNDNGARLDQIIEMISRLASGNLETRLDISEAGDQLDVIITGLNMLAEELEAAIDSERRLRSSLEEKVEARTRELKEKIRTIEEQSRTIQELSTPVLRIWDQVLVLPLVGSVDDARARQIVDSLLESVARNRASRVILDITGVPSVDSAVAHHFMKIIEAVRLLGADVILTGVSPANAITLTRMGIGLEGVQIQRSLQEGLQLALR